jgi:CBS domain-containing protein
MPTLGEMVKEKQVRFVKINNSVAETAEFMANHDIGAVPVLDGDQLVGIFSERDLMKRCVTKRIDIDSTKVEDVMTKRVIVMEASDSYEDCLRIMKQENIRHMPVIDGDKLTGVISIRDLMQVDMDEKEQKIDILNSYIHYNPKG